MTDRIDELARECLNALNQLRELEPGAAMAPEVLHQRIREFIDGMRTQAREARFPDRDINDVAYAIVALADEVALGKPEPVRGYWISRPLQLHYFNENVAGDGFYQRLQTLRGDRRRLDVLRVYYLCLLFGFQGRYGMHRGGERELVGLIDGIKEELAQAYEFPERLAPDGEPPDEPAVPRADRKPWLWVSLGALAVSLAFYIVLRVILNAEVDAAIVKVTKLGELAR